MSSTNKDSTEKRITVSDLATVNQTYNNLLNSMIIISPPFIGKTEALLQLKNSALIDWDGTGLSYPGTIFSIKQIALKYKVGPLNATIIVMDALEELKAQGKGFDFIIPDSITSLNKMLMPVATAEYRKSDAGSTFKGSNAVLQAGWAAGEKYLAEEFRKVHERLIKIPSTCLIYTAHTKADVESPDTDFADIECNKYIKTLLLHEMAAVGVLYRSADNPNVNFLSFKTMPGDQAKGARPQHLSNKIIRLSERVEKDNGYTLKTNWKEVFPDNYK